MSTYTPKDLERAMDLVCDESGMYDVLKPEEVAELIATVREECAKVARSFASSDVLTNDPENNMALDIAKAIRELGK